MGRNGGRLSMRSADRGTAGKAALTGNDDGGPLAYNPEAPFTAAVNLKR
jgi:hypothetical protein